MTHDDYIDLCFTQKFAFASKYANAQKYAENIFAENQRRIEAAKASRLASGRSLESVGGATPRVRPRPQVAQQSVVKTVPATKAVVQPAQQPVTKSTFNPTLYVPIDGSKHKAMPHTFKHGVTQSYDNMNAIVNNANNFLSDVGVNMQGRVNSPEARQMMLGIAAKESSFKSQNQLKGGPARGLFQIEPKTFDDILYRSIKNKHRGMYDAIMKRYAPNGERLTADSTSQYPELGAMIARMKLWEKSEALPKLDDITAQADYAQRHYHTSKDPIKRNDYTTQYGTNYNTLIKPYYK